MKVIRALLPRRVTHQIACQAPPPDVWSVLREPQRWPEFEPFLSRVEGAAGHAVEGQRLLGVARAVPLRIPLDVRRVVPRKTLSVRVHSLPGLREDLEIMLVPATRGGTQITIVTHLSGPLATGALVPRWVMSGVTARLLVRAAERAQQLRLRDSSGVA